MINEKVETGMFVGALTMSRIVLDAQLSEAILTETKKAISAHQLGKTRAADTV